MLENPASVVTTGGELLILAIAMGSVAGDLWVLPCGKNYAHFAATARLRTTLWKMLGVCLALFTPLLFVDLVVRTANMSDTTLLEALPEIGKVLSSSHYGKLWSGQTGVLLVLWLCWGVRLFKPSCILTAVAFASLTAIAFLLSASGHAGDDGLLSPANIANTLHIVGAWLWGGGIIAMTTVILPALVRTQPDTRELMAAASLRLSTLAGIALVLALIPGIYNAWLQVGSWQGLRETLYGRLLAAKILLVGGMMALGALNRYRYVPAIQEYAGRPLPRTLLPLPHFIRAKGDTASGTRFLRSLRIEAALLFLVLALASALSQQTPAAHAGHDDMAGHNHGTVQ